MRVKLGMTFLKVGKIMKRHRHTLEDIKKTLSFSFKALRPQLDLCQDIGSILQLICDTKCSLNDIRILEVFVSELNIRKAQDIVQEYKDAVKEFSKTELSKCLNEKFSYGSLLHCQKINIVVNKNTDDVTIDDVKELLNDLFQDEYSQDVQLEVIRKGQSFTIICSFPLILTEELIATTLENIQLLKKKWIKRLTIGYCTIYEVWNIVYYIM